MKELHAGYISSAVWDLLDDLSGEIIWRDVVRSLSHFVVDHDIGGDGEWSAELSVLNNLISRGLPTLAPLSVERWLSEEADLTEVDEKGEAGITGRIAVDVRDAVERERLIDFVERALCTQAQDVELEATPGFELPAEENVRNENDFLRGPLFDWLGPAGVQLLCRQRPFSTIAGDAHGQFERQRVDFALGLPGSREGDLQGVIIELDGPEHHDQNANQRVLDGERDRMAGEVGWETCRRTDNNVTHPIPHGHAAVSRLMRHPYFSRVLRSQEEPLQADPVGRRVLTLVVAPFAIARLQKVLIEAIRGGILQLGAENWRLAVIERDCPCAEIALQDFQEWVANLQHLGGLPNRLPNIDLRVVPVHADNQPAMPRRGWTADLLIDVSVLMRYGVRSTAGDGIADAIPCRSRVTIRSGYYPATARRLSFGPTAIYGNPADDTLQALDFFLKNIFRKSGFRDKQREIVEQALQGRSVIALLPTGAGKSLCYQLATLLQNGLSLVVDPLKSLMKDQVDGLQMLGIDTALFINSSLRARERQKNTEALRLGEAKFVFVSPERLVIQEFRDALAGMENVHFAFGVVDEAHCVSEWGHDFRTAYLQLGANLRRFCPTERERLPILALTGTASHEVLDDVQRELELGGELPQVVKPDKMEREELHFKIVPLAPFPEIPANAHDWEVRQQVGDAKHRALVQSFRDIGNLRRRSAPEGAVMERDGRDSGLVFCPHRTGRHGVTDVQASLQRAFHDGADRIGKFFGSSDDGGFNDEDAIRAQDDFKADRTQILVCTKAFGMGIDKPDIRCTVHFNMPQSLEAFYQEAGRAGRDRQDAHCWLLYGGVNPNNPDMPSVDWELIHAFHRNTFRGEDHERQMILDLLDENRMPGTNVPRALCDHLEMGFGKPFRANPWQGNQQGIRRLYLNEREGDREVGYLRIPELRLGPDGGYEGGPEILRAAADWLRENLPEGNDIWAWLNQFSPSEGRAGLEETLEGLDPDGRSLLVIPFQNGMAADLAEQLRIDGRIWSEGLVLKAYEFAFSEEAFLEHLVSEYGRDYRGRRFELTDQQVQAARACFGRIRTSAQTFRAIYRLCILGAVEDYTYDYNSKTVSARLHPQPEGGYIQALGSYVSLYVSPEDAGRILAEAQREEQPTELRRCVCMLVKFVYERIAERRLEALRTMERTVRAGINNPDAFAEQVNLYFDSRYTADLREFLRDYTETAVFDFLNLTRGEPAQMAHLMGSCNRLLEENPENAMLHAIRACTYALSPAYEENVVEELERSLQLFESQQNWSRRQKCEFVLRLVEYMEGVETERVTHFLAVLLREHTAWLRSFGRNLEEVLANGREQSSPQSAS